MRTTYHAQKGVGMMEVLVSMLILTVAILGFVAVQVRATSATQEALKRSDAIVILNGLAEKIRLNSGANYNTVIPTTAPACLTSNNCTPVTQVAADLYTQQQLATSKFISLGVVSCPNTSTRQTRLCLIAAWDDTTATVGADTDTNRCLNSADGRYASQSHCLVLEAY